MKKLLESWARKILSKKRKRVRKTAPSVANPNIDPNRDLAAWIIYQLVLRGATQEKIARAVGVDQSMVTKVIWGDKRSARVQGAISRAIGYSNWDELVRAQRSCA
jgi:hypothetical protein